MRRSQPEGEVRAPYGRGRAIVHLAAWLLAGTLPASAAPADDVHIFALGDSLTAGYGLPRRQGYVPQLEAYLRRQGIRARITNAGVSGDTAAQGRQRLAWTLQGLKQPPQLAIVALGANDMLRGLPPQQTRAELDAILAELKGRNMRLLLSGMVAAPNLGPDYARNFNSIYPDLAQKHGATLQPFFLEGVAGDRALNQPDAIHPNFAGVKRMVLTIAPKVVEALER
ncbi:MAG TPA: arylesterase [Allosphingosinicella sp.]|nr:arylesterase [Allosphingosinicella sp.]